ncbi:HutD/Ves family protein [Paraburkholderia sartisoli]|uniref:Histidine utilization protein HutD n=1 Tax=Paraburkholderia sartisoli TaxID=83784 RepID=A0A1H4EMJ9_9BURK|nr:HutD family protein [Paraburkholderia sartisoli]SEA85750.1 hypothetical protein SAMN05192564_103451 [Paraburkholderia sartisoli]
MARALNPAQVSLLRGVDLVASPWKNGGGVTREIAVAPEGAALDTFVWRVSVADVAQPGPFSRFAGIDRALVLLAGAGMLLDDAEGHTHALTQPLDIARFTGEASIDARLVDGATRDFNLMVRRGAATGDIEVWRGATEHTLTADVALLFCAAGQAEITLEGHAPFHLADNDTLRIDAPHALACIVKCAGAVLATGVRYA